MLIFMSSIQVSQTLSTSSCCHEYGSVSVCYRVRGEIYCEIEELGLLLVGASLGQAGFAEVSVWYAGFDRLGGTAVLEALGHVVVLHVHHVLDGAEGGFWRLFHLEVRQRIVLWKSVLKMEMPGVNREQEILMRYRTIHHA